MNTTTQTEYPIATRWEMITGEEPPADLSRIPAEQAEELIRLFAPLAQAVSSLAPDARAIVVQDEADEACMADAVEAHTKHMQALARTMRRDVPKEEQP